MIVALYVDGGIIGTNPSPHGGTWAWVAVDEHDQKVDEASGLYIHPEGKPVSNNVTEWLALYMGLMNLPHGWSGRVYSDSRLTLGRFFWGWACKGIDPTWLPMRDFAVARLGSVEPILLQGHPSKKDLDLGVGRKGQPVSKWNVYCDSRCGWESQRYFADKEAINGRANTG